MFPANNERDLLLKAQQGDGAAFGDLVRQHQTAVYNVAYRLLGRRRDAEDAAQEAFLRAFTALDRFDVERPFAPWIKRITTNLCLNRLGSSQSKTQVLASDLGNDETNPVDLDRWAHADPTPEQVMVSHEQAGQVRAAILRLPPRYRVVIELRHFQDLSYQEMAETLGRPLSSVKSDLFRARKLLAQRMREGA